MEFNPRVVAMVRGLLPALAAAACGGGDRPVAWSGSVDTLASGAVRVSNPTVGLWESGAEIPWTLVAEREISALQGDPETVFSSVSGLAVDGEGRILAIGCQRPRAAAVRQPARRGPGGGALHGSRP